MRLAKTRLYATIISISIASHISANQIHGTAGASSTYVQGVTSYLAPTVYGYLSWQPSEFFKAKIGYELKTSEQLPDCQGGYEYITSHTGSATIHMHPLTPVSLGLAAKKSMGPNNFNNLSGTLSADLNTSKKISFSALASLGTKDYLFQGISPVSNNYGFVSAGISPHLSDKTDLKIEGNYSFSEYVTVAGVLPYQLISARISVSSSLSDRLYLTAGLTGGYDSTASIVAGADSAIFFELSDHLTLSAGINDTGYLSSVVTTATAGKTALDTGTGKTGNLLSSSLAFLDTRLYFDCAYAF